MRWPTRKFLHISSKMIDHIVWNIQTNTIYYMVSVFPLFLSRFGENIRIVNFGNVGQQPFTLLSGKQSDSVVNIQQPWNYKFNLRKAELEQCPFETTAIDNYYKFYLRCFMCRVWPLVSNVSVRYCAGDTIKPYGANFTFTENHSYTFKSISWEKRMEYYGTSAGYGSTIWH